MKTATREKPILFSGPMVRAILEGRKTQTRRVVKPQPRVFHFLYDITDDGRKPACNLSACPFQVGMNLWVRETWAMESNCGYTDICDAPGKPLGPIRWHDDEESRWFECPRYRASEPATELIGDDDVPMRWRPSIFMPRWASRLTLRITGVRVERLQEITEADAQAEGVEAVSIDAVPRQAAWSCRQDFVQIWDVLNAKRGYSWESNPFCWVLAFERMEQSPGA